MARKRTFLLVLAALCTAGMSMAVAQAASAGRGHRARGTVRWRVRRMSDEVRTTTPIKHLVVIFQENVSFDH